MRKFIVVFDGLRFSEGAMEFAINLAKMNNAHVVGVFLEDFTRHSYSTADIVEYSGASFDKHVQHLEQRDFITRNHSIEIFESACKIAGIQFNIHRDHNLALQELYHESVYADLLIIDAKETLSRKTEHLPTRFIQEVLCEAQCPVLIVPSKFIPINKVVLLYDGEPSSVFSAKSFSYLLPAQSNEQITVVTVKPPGNTLHVPESKLIKEFIKRHFANATFEVLIGHPEEEIVKFLLPFKNDTIVVTGAYRRNRISRLFKQSMADLLMEKLRIPIFIAHQ